MERKISKDTLMDIASRFFNSEFFDAYKKAEAYLEKNKDNIAKALKFFNEYMDSLPEKTKTAMEIVQKEGWFLGFYDFSSFSELTQLVDGIIDHQENINFLMCDFYSRNLDVIEAKLADMYPERKRVICAAINAHKRGDDDGYLLSIPVFIAQADGLLKDFFGKDLILSQRNKSTVSEMIVEYSKVDDDYFPISLLLTPLGAMHGTEFLATKKDRGKHGDLSFINRNEIMHGINSCYGSKENSLKVLSFLAYVGISLPEANFQYKKEEENKK